MFTNCDRKDLVIRYWIVFYDPTWNELERMRLGPVTWGVVESTLDMWYRASTQFLRSGDVVPCGTAEAQYVSVEMGYVEI